MISMPVSLYIHIPWCIKKCPYCDFNSHTQQGELPEKDYIAALISDFKSSIKNLSPNTTLISIFIGGGTPSLFSPQAYKQLFTGLQALLPFDPNIEITLEANPESVKLNRFIDYKKIGINRISLGIQSFNNVMLQRLGRAHDALQAKIAIESITQAGFTNFNLDLMFGLPSQTIQEALADLKYALQFPATHLSWYQLTLEPNTPFYQHPPHLPDDDLLWDMQSEGQALLAKNGFVQYEVSAYTRSQACQHNLNYWTFGDYIGIGCGAHGKINNSRTVKIRHPKAYLQAHQNHLDLTAKTTKIAQKELPFEFMLNTLRLTQGFCINLFNERTGLPLDTIAAPLQKAKQLKLLNINNAQNIICPTPQGARFLNDLITIFL